MIQEVKALPLVFLVSGCLLILPAFIYPADWAGWVLVYGSFALPLLFARVRKDRKLLIIFLVLVSCLNAISIYNAYASTIYWAGLDATVFQERARDLALGRQPVWFIELGTLEVGTNIYTRLLAMFYRVFGVSLLLGQSLSVIAYTLSGILFIHLLHLLKFRFKKAIFVIFGFSAPAIIYCSVTMREAWQVLFFILIIYLALRLRAAPSILKVVGIALSGLVYGLLHNGLFVYSLALVGWSLYWGASGKWKQFGYKKIVIRVSILATAITAVAVWTYLGGEIGGIAGAIKSGEAANYTEIYRERGEQDAAANYQVKVDSSSTLSLVLSSSEAFLYYQFAPFPWQVRRVIDLYAAAEALIRLILIFYMFKLWWWRGGEGRRTCTYLIVCYLSQEFLWSLGTANWGTAVRHHIIAYGILVLLGAPGLVYSLKNLLLKLKFRPSKASRLKQYEVGEARIVN